MVPADSGRIPRVPPYSGTALSVRLCLRLRAFHPLRGRFPASSADFAYRRAGGPTTPVPALRRDRFGLLRFRSPLLAQSRLLSFPPGTEMFQFPGFASPLDGDAGLPLRVAPFGYPRINGYVPLHAAFRSLSRPSSPPGAQASFMCPSLLSFFFFGKSLLALACFAFAYPLASLRISLGLPALLLSAGARLSHILSICS